MYFGRRRTALWARALHNKKMMVDWNNQAGKVGPPPVIKRKPPAEAAGVLYRAVSARPDEVLPEFVRRHRQHGASKQVSAFRQDGML